MARSHRRLTTLSVNSRKPLGYYADGDGLYLQITSTDARSWIFRYMLAGRRREMGLGALSEVSLAEARARATAARQMVKAGQDPIEARDAEKARQRLEEARGIPFDEAVRLYVADHEGAWRNAVHRQQWKNTLATYASPLIGSLSVSAIGTPEVTKVLDPIWSTITETAIGCGGASSSSWIGPRREATARARTRCAGAAISTPSTPSAASSGR